MLLNIKLVQFRLIWLCNFCDIYMPNVIKFFETPVLWLMRRSNYWCQMSLVVLAPVVATCSGLCVRPIVLLES